ncbi:reverse transcriptase N-terminal domain-containing protein [Candidatus Contubernalis alkalaceticus]|nr:reverse transcriptase N-terminal domain-containing protein [Candidatus Contubernalis alkalaceticus]
MRNTSLKMKSTLPDDTKTWKQINWVHVNRYVEKLQQRIFRAESFGNKRKVRELQRLLMHSKSALLVSIRKITQINKGKKTAGARELPALAPGNFQNLPLGDSPPLPGASGPCPWQFPESPSRGQSPITLKH